VYWLEETVKWLLLDVTVHYLAWTQSRYATTLWQ